MADKRNLVVVAWVLQRLSQPRVGVPALSVRRRSEPCAIRLGCSCVRRGTRNRLKRSLQSRRWGST